MNSRINIHGMFAIRKKRGWKDFLLAMELYRLWSNFAMQPGDRIGGMGMENIIKECGKYGEDAEYTVYKRYI